MLSGVVDSNVNKPLKASPFVIVPANFQVIGAAATGLAPRSNNIDTTSPRIRLERIEPPNLVEDSGLYHKLNRGRGTGEQIANVLPSLAMALRVCTVGY